MERQPVLNFLRQYGGLLLLTVTGALLGAIAWSQQQTQPLSPSPTPSLIASPSPSPRSIAVPSPTVSPSPKPPSASSTPAASTTPRAGLPELTEEQKALNQQYKDQFRASLASVDSLIEMKVAIVEGASALSISVNAESQVIDDTNQTLKTLAPATAYSIATSGNAIVINGQTLPQLVWITPPPNSLIEVNQAAFRGRFLLAADNGRLWAVNFVNLRNYLCSVVGSEVSPSWEMDALKAQAVAARSYALTYYFEPMSQLFQLGATEYYQVYKGVDREADRTCEAVDATAGEYVSHQGGIVESLYAASDDIVREAFQGHGMSQLGALSLAEQGYLYDQILANYYPGTKVGRIVQEFE